MSVIEFPNPRNADTRPVDVCDDPTPGSPVPGVGSPTTKSVVRAVIIERATRQLTTWQDELEMYTIEWAGRGYTAMEARSMAYAQMCGYFEHHIRCLLAILEEQS